MRKDAGSHVALTLAPWDRLHVYWIASASSIHGDLLKLNEGTV